MLSTPIKALLGVLGAVAVVAVVGYATGEFDRFMAPPPAQLANVPAAPEPKPAEPAAQSASVNPAATTEDKPASTAGEAANPAAQPAQPAATEPAKAEVVPPSFDLLRVEPDGSIVIAGQAPAASKVEVLAGSKVIGAAVATPEGDFAVVIDQPLAPGSYQIVLRATDEANTVAMSVETAVVSIPEKPDGQVLALVEQPGQPSKLITVPEPMTSTPAPTETAAAPALPEPKPVETAAAPQAASPSAAPSAEAGTTEAKPAETATAEPKPAEPKPAEVAAATPEPAKPAPAANEPAPAPGALQVEVRAIEIEGNKVFVAGVASPKRVVRVYANEKMLGEARASEGGEFLVEALVDLPVGDYIVRADLLADDGNKVLMRAQVPFRREAGESIAAVAPAKPAAEAKPATDSASSQPAANAAAGQTAGSSEQQAAAPSTQTQAAAQQPAASGQQAAAETAAPAASAADASAPAASTAAQNAAADPAKPAAETAQSTAAAATEPVAVTSAPLQAADGAVIIRRGDSLWRISRRVYGRGVRYSTIYLANQKQISDPDRIWPGQVFTVPVKTSEGETANMDAMGGQAVSPEDLEKYPPVR